MRVMATRQGQMCNILIEAGWVFDLRDDMPEGAARMNVKGEIVHEGDGYPVREDWVPKLALDPKTKQMVDTGEGEYVVFTDPRTKRPIHRDFSRDDGAVMLRRGPIRGETVQVGWMREVSESVPVTDFDGTPLNELLEQNRHGFNPDSRAQRRVSPSLRPDPVKIPGSGVSGEIRPIAQAG